METCIGLYKTFRSTGTGVAEGVKSELRLDPAFDGCAEVSLFAEASSCSWKRQVVRPGFQAPHLPSPISIDAFDPDHKLIVGCYLYLKIKVKSQVLNTVL